MRAFGGNWARDLVHQSNLKLENEMAAAKRDPAITADSLDVQIANSLLERRAY
jgi:hypothetical protein